jgi:hypothetical protein
MRRLFLAAIALAIVLPSIGCSENSKPTAQSSAESAQDKEIEELKTRVRALEQKPVQHHYELRTEGSRSFRFDPETGDSCIKLASKPDWKNADTIRQGCEYQDFLNAPLSAGENYATRQNTAECIFVGKCDQPK